MQNETILLTDRAFFKAKSVTESSASQSGEISLGITKDELVNLGLQNQILLEIGPGYLKSTAELEKLGFKMYAIEPGLKTGESATIMKCAENLEIHSPLLPITAAELLGNDEIHDDSVAMAIAIGPNFQNYKMVAKDLMADFRGIFSKLEKEQGVLIFEVYRGGNDLAEI